VIHNVAPSGVLLALLVFVLADSARKSARSAFKMSASEEKKEQTAAQASPEPSQSAPEDTSTSPASTEQYFIGDKDKEQKSMLPSGAGWLLTIWGSLVIIDILKGELLSLCSPAWWSATFGAVALLGGFSLHFAQKLSERERTSAQDLDFDKLAFPLARWGFLAGILAAICGIGGGMVLGPILIEMNVHPQVSAATTATTLLVLSSSTGMVYWCRGVAPLDYSLAMSAATMCGAMTGKIVIGWWVEKTGRKSAIVWCLLLITVLSASLMGLLGLLRVIETGWNAFVFKNFCHAAKV